MLPTADALLAGWAFVARRHGVTGTPSRPALEAALRAASDCADGREEHEPAALFYGLARHPRAFPGGWGLASRVYATTAAATLGAELVAQREDLSALRLAVAQGRADCAAVKLAFAGWLVPRGE